MTPLEIAGVVFVYLSVGSTFYGFVFSGEQGLRVPHFILYTIAWPLVMISIIGTLIGMAVE